MKFYNYSYFINEDTEIDPDLEDIRYFRGSFKQFKDFWERKTNTKFNPRDKVEYEYPVKRTEKDNSIPYQDYMNGNSAQVKYLLKTRKNGI